MKNILRLFLLLTIFNTISQVVFSQKVTTEILDKRWAAQWIVVPKESNDGYGVYLFRKKLDLKTKPNSFVIHVSADNRYKLFVNEKLVSLGPARGDLTHWNFETIDIAPFLTEGKNIVSAQVWNEGDYKPEAQITLQTGFILQGGTEPEQVLNTNATWLCVKDNSFSPLRFTIPTYYVAGAGEIRNMVLHQNAWQTLNFDDTSWQKAQTLFAGTPKNILGAYGSPNGWMLVPSMIPQMEMKDERIQKVVSVSENFNLPIDYPQKKSDIVIPANANLKIILDQTYLTNAYPNLEFSGGKNGTITLKYAEALFTKFPYKANRNETVNKIFLGRTDSLISDGSMNQKFVSLTYRTFRFLQINIITKDEPLVLNDVFSTFTGYPFELNSNLKTTNSEIDKIIEIGWRTARLCATETYMDCPYYEQLQYIGDGRIQALVSLYNSGDDRLVKNAINQIDFSRQPEGITLSRHPSFTQQYIPTFSLWYIGMLQDYARYGKDTDFIKQKLGGMHQILGYFKNYQQLDGSLKKTPQWMFTDWVDDAKGWKAGIAPMGKNGGSAALDLQLLLAYQVALDLENKLNNATFSKQYQKEIDVLKKTIRAKYWDENKKLFADTEEKDVFSQHSNALAILTEVAVGVEKKQLSEQLLNNKTLAPASIYFKYYVHQALIKAGLGNDYLKWLAVWKENIAQGLTTWAEISEIDKSRSDCHAWGSSPNIEFYRTVLGIDSDEIGFKKVKIMPHLGDLTTISGSIPHPNGMITTSYKLENNKWKINISLPKTITGKLIWKGKTYTLKEGENLIVI